MLRIRQEQLDVFRRHMDRAFLEQLTRQLQEEFADRLSGAADARRQAELTIRTAEEANIEPDDSVIELARLMMQFGNGLEDFPDAAWAGAILFHSSLPGDLKIDFLRRRLEPRAETNDEEA